MKKLIIAAAVLFIVEAVAGAVCRTTFTNYDDMEDYNVATISGEYVSGLGESYIDALENSDYILKVRCTSDMAFAFLITYQPVEVETVFKGVDVSAGDVINVMRSSSQIFGEDDGDGIRSVNMGFANEMNKDEEYLIFLDEVRTSRETGEVMYVTPEVIMTPIFSYSEHTNIIPEQPYEDNTYVPYTAVADNEFFIDSQEGFDKMNEIKQMLTAKYAE